MLPKASKVVPNGSWKASQVTPNGGPPSKFDGHLARKCIPSRTKTYARKKNHGKTICAIPYARRPNFKPRGAKMRYCRKNASKRSKKYWFYIGLSSIFLNTISEFIENRWRNDTFWIQTSQNCKTFDHFLDGPCQNHQTVVIFCKIGVFCKSPSAVNYSRKSMFWRAAGRRVL